MGIICRIRGLGDDDACERRRDLRRFFVGGKWGRVQEEGVGLVQDAGEVDGEG